MMGRWWSWILIVAVCCIALPSYATNLQSEDQTKVRMLINLMDYIAKDYRMAVKDSVVINDFEYAEMQEFSENALGYYTELKGKSIIQGTEGEEELNRLIGLIELKASPSVVSVQADLVKEVIVGLDLVPLAPLEWPNQKVGSSLFDGLCAPCHGPTGKGDGSAGEGLTPAPTDLTDREIMDGISPLQAFNTITLGIDGTSMRGFKELTEKQVWDIAFFTMELAYKGVETKDQNNDIPLLDAATMSNEELTVEYPELDVPTLRLEGFSNQRGPLDLARQLLIESESALVSGNTDEAISLALKAYLQGVEPVEPKIMASDNKLFVKLETSMMGLREGLKNEGPENIAAKFDLAHESIDEAEALLGSTERNLWMTATITLSILLREGLEAFFVILAILGILQSMGAKSAIRWVHSGWIIAVLFGIGGWFFAEALMDWDAQSRELMEGVIALFAVLILLYLGFWMHGKTNAEKWKEFVETKIKALLNRNNMIGLASFSFLVVFREAFESVLFLSSLTVDGSTESSNGVLVGTIMSAVLLFFIAWAMLKWFKRMPIAKVFLYSSIVVLALAFILSGNGIHAIQEGGYIGIRSFPLNIRISLLGIYPTYETMLTQVVVLVSIIMLWKYSTSRPSSSKQV